MKARLICVIAFLFLVLFQSAAMACVDYGFLPQRLTTVDTPADQLPCVYPGYAASEPGSVVVYFYNEIGDELGFIDAYGRVLNSYGQVRDSGNTFVPQMVVAILMSSQIRDHVALPFIALSR